MNYKIDVIDNWKDFIEEINILKSSDGWIFRGQKHNDFNAVLQTNIEFHANRYKIEIRDLARIEQGLIREFKRNYNNYNQYFPDDDDWIGWLSIMEHYGAPTRLLDVTYSPYIALFFSIARVKIDNNGETEFWAFNSDKINEVYWEFTRQEDYYKLHKDAFTKNDYKEYHQKVLENRIPFIHIVNSFHQNERQKIQQGAFLIPTNIKQTLEQNIEGVERIVGASEMENVIRIIKLKCNEEFIGKALGELKTMNITSSSLFPGLSGYSESLQMRLLLNEGLVRNKDSF